MTEQDRRQVTRWTPFADEFFSPEGRFRDLRFPFSRLARQVEPSGEASGMLAPAIDVTESEDKYVVTAELPGVGKDDISLEVHDDTLSIRGEKRSEREGEKDKRHWVERSYGAFRRSIRIPTGLQQSDLAASFKDGVLRVEIPKPEERKPRTVSIK
jgi:HSP20 family protein